MTITWETRYGQGKTFRARSKDFKEVFCIVLNAILPQELSHEELEAVQKALPDISILSVGGGEV